MCSWSSFYVWGEAFLTFLLSGLCCVWGVSHILVGLLLLQQLEKRAGPVGVHLSLHLSGPLSALYKMYLCCWNLFFCCCFLRTGASTQQGFTSSLFFCFCPTIFWKWNCCFDRICWLLKILVWNDLVKNNALVVSRGKKTFHWKVLEYCDRRRIFYSCIFLLL